MSAAEAKSYELLKRSYSDEEISSIYELGRLFLENGDLRRSRTIFAGLNEVAPEFGPSWLGMAYLQIVEKNYDAAMHSIKQALRVEPNSLEVTLFLISCLLTIGDYNSAGTYLGEVADKIEAGAVDNQNILRLYRAQLARFQSRG